MRPWIAATNRKKIFDRWVRGIIFLLRRAFTASFPQTGRPSVLNRFDPHSPSAGEAEVRFLDGDFRVIRPGAFVKCAVTGAAIPLEELKYWSVERQEAYLGPDMVLKRLHPDRVP
jgi:hypothetical protein